VSGPLEVTYTVSFGAGRPGRREDQALSSERKIADAKTAGHSWAVFLGRQRNAALVISGCPKCWNRPASAHAPVHRPVSAIDFREPAKPTGEHCMNPSS
jgi:hypothetical protein